jgi:Arc/MetJ family transcription regulator
VDNPARCGQLHVIDIYLNEALDILGGMKHLVDLDEAALDAARRHLGTTTLKDTVNAALRLASGQDSQGRDLDAALDVLAGTRFDDRADAWR